MASAQATTAPAKEARPARSARRRPAGAETGDFWVQVGAFRDVETARRVAQKLRDQNYRVHESTTMRAPAGRTGPAEAPTGDRYDVFVSGPSPADITSRLAAKGLSVEGAEGGAVVRPSLSLREAVALSRDLAGEGFKVQVKRASGAGPAPAPSAPPQAADTLHRVRVTGFPDRPAAIETQKKLETQGYAGFIGRGEP